MKLIVSKETLLIALLFYIIPVFDTFGLLINEYFPFLVVTRAIVFSVGLYVLLVSNVFNRQLKVLMALFILYGLISICAHYLIVENPMVLKMEMQSFAKLLYFPILFFTLFLLYKRNIITNHDIEKAMLFYSLLILSSLIVGYLTGYGGEIGGRGSNIQASKGFMIGANEVGLMLLLTLSFFVTNLNKYFSIIKSNLIALLLYGFAALIVFTKSSLSVLLVGSVNLFKDMISSRKNYIKYFYFLLLFTLFAFMLIYLSLNYAKIFDYLMGTFFISILDGNFIGFFFRGRQDYIEAIFPQLIDNSLNWLIFLFGAGEYWIRFISEAPLLLEHGGGTLFEMDFFDLFAIYGIFGFGLYLGLLIPIFHLTKNSVSGMMKFILFLVFIHAFIAGHVLFSPQVTTLLSFILIYHFMLKTPRTV